MRSVIIWTEGGAGIGIGHISRCIVIAERLRKGAAGPVFWINDDPAARTRVAEVRHPFEIVSFDSVPEAKLFKADGKVVVVDTRKRIERVLQTLKRIGSRIVLVDNATDSRLFADAVIYPSAIFENTLNWTDFGGKVYFGAPYVPLADSFIRATSAGKDKPSSPPWSILVTMGGSDPNRQSYKIVSSLLESRYDLQITVIVGPAFPKDERLDMLERHRRRNVRFIRNCRDLSSIIAGSHIAITALGTTLHELAFMGVPAIIIANYREDEQDMNAFWKLGTALPLGYHEDVSSASIRATVEELIGNRTLRERMGRSAVIDGKGADRIAEIIKAQIR